MSLLDDINDFNTRQIQDPLGAHEVALWYALLAHKAYSGGVEEFTVPISVLCTRAGLSERAMIRSRKKLEEAGLITWHKNGGRTAATYRLNRIYVGRNGTPNGNQMSVECPSNVHINNINNMTNKVLYNAGEDHQLFIDAYPKKTVNILAVDRALTIATASTDFNDLCIAAKNYAEHCSILGLEDRFIKEPQNFLKDDYFIAFMPGQYKKPVKAKKESKQQFNDFKQNDIDFDELHKRVFAN